MFKIFAQGFLLQASLILALGAQNIFILNSGLRKQSHILAALISTLCDTLLIFIGVLGVATVFVQVPLLKISLGMIGVLFLVFYGVLKLKAAKNNSVISKEDSTSTSAKQVILASLGFSLLNPHVYLDTIVLIGGYSTQFKDMTDRFYFGAGASAFSTLWFFGLSFSAALASRLLSSNIALRIISLISGLILIILAIKLGSDVLGWIYEAKV